MERLSQSLLNMAASIPGCHFWQRRDVCSPTLFSFKCNRTAQHLFIQRESHSLQHIPRSNPTHLPATIVGDTVSYQWEESVPMRFSVAPSDKTIVVFQSQSVTVFSPCHGKAGQKWLCVMWQMEGAMITNLFGPFCLIPHCQIHTKSLTKDVS